MIVALLFLSIVALLWAICIGAFGVIALPVLLIGTLCGLVIVFEA